MRTDGQYFHLIKIALMEFTIETIIPAVPFQVYQAWLDSDQHSQMTGGGALITEDKFSTWDGYIWGTNLELKPHEYIKQTWRTSEFADDQANSIVEIFLEEHDNVHTLLRLHHSELTEDDIKYKQGWEEHYFTPMKAYFSNL